MQKVAHLPTRNNGIEDEVMDIVQLLVQAGFNDTITFVVSF